MDSTTCMSPSPVRRARGQVLFPWRAAGRRVGYSALKRNSPSNGSTGKFNRRVFWVKKHGRSERPEGVYKTTTPSEGAAPRTVVPCVWLPILTECISPESMIRRRTRATSGRQDRTGRSPK
ncbi:DUF6009 family protein [Streptomyces scopuliridis]|uniref:DUF6009 family protein n=1 Tax=Streptomyces scopuliridis TaxID=452529 RepID=UPI00389A7A96